MRELALQDPEAQFRFRGGDSMKAAGGELFRHYGENSVMGGAEVVARAGALLADLRTTKRDVVAWSPDVLILIDFPAFNLRVAKYAHRRGIRVFWYIAPKLWARGEGRIRKIRRYVDELFVIFPFETDYFAGLGVKAHYFGNPLLDMAGQPQGSPEVPRTGDGERRIIALLPGSRMAELRWMMPRLVKMEQLMGRDEKWASCKLVISGAPAISPSDYVEMIPAGSRIEVRYGDTCDLLRRASAAVVCSGTASLEAALVGVPQEVCYGFNRITWLLARLTVRLRHISLPNIILGRESVKELLQAECTPEAMLDELESLLNDESRRRRTAADCEELRSIMGNPGAATRLASGIIALLESK